MSDHPSSAQLLTAWRNAERAANIARQATELAKAAADAAEAAAEAARLAADHAGITLDAADTATISARDAYRDRQASVPKGSIADVATFQEPARSALQIDN